MTDRLIAPDDGLKQVEVDGATAQRGADGAFRVDGQSARTLLKTGDWVRATIRFNGVGYRCQDCRFLALVSDKCRCGSANLVRED